MPRKLRRAFAQQNDNHLLRIKSINKNKTQLTLDLKKGYQINVNYRLMTECQRGGTVACLVGRCVRSVTCVHCAALRPLTQLRQLRQLRSVRYVQWTGNRAYVGLSVSPETPDQLSSVLDGRLAPSSTLDPDRDRDRDRSSSSSSGG